MCDIFSFFREDWAKKLVHWKNEFVSTLQHYWLGIKLLGADVRISSRLLVKLARGKSLSRRERQQLTRTTADIFRLVPVAIFIIVPFMEFLLPVFLKLFPNMLPSTFQDKMKEQVLSLLLFAILFCFALKKTFTLYKYVYIEYFTSVCHTRFCQFYQYPVSRTITIDLASPTDYCSTKMKVVSYFVWLLQLGKK